ncbi:MAG: TIGR03668 family PPOX class F420-dependent oxidoreductase [Actinomycetota bacterium]|nr:TIGR03668 family PPOX class F420-dependent oxidoreductase [Actinomycetota bacterium]
MGGGWARDQFQTQRVARLATADSAGVPHLVPIVFTVDGDTIYFAVDDKPKGATRLRRLENIAANARVSVLVDHYGEDWSALWWARADGSARVVDGAAEERDAIELLAGRYDAYVLRRPPGPVVAIAVARWSGWMAGAG